jgi:SulP family sulfate permease
MRFGIFGVIGKEALTVTTGAGRRHLADRRGRRRRRAQSTGAVGQRGRGDRRAGVPLRRDRAAAAAGLAALVVFSALHMIEPKTFRAVARIRRLEWCWAIATLAGVILIGTVDGILIAVAMSVVTLFYQANHPPVYAVAYNRATDIFRRVGEDDTDETVPGLLVLRTEGRLTFANAANAADKIRALVSQAQPKVLVLECSAIPDIEYTALAMLTEAEQNLRARGVTLRLAAVNPDLLKILERSPLGATLGRARMFANLRKALEAWRERGDHSSPTER